MKRDGGRRGENMGLEVRTSPRVPLKWRGQAVCGSVCAVFLGNPQNLTENKHSDGAVWVSLENSREMV